MEKQDIIRKFLTKGIMLDEAMLNKLYNNPQSIETTLENLSLGKTTQQPLIEVRPFSQYNREEITPNSLIQMLQQRYSKIQNLIERQLPDNLISLNKISPNTSEFSLIVMIRENNGNTLVIEDSTGEATVSLSKELSDKAKFLVEDEIVGLVCKQEEGIQAEQIIWPDIPLVKEVTREEEKFCIFISNPQETDYDKIKKIADDKTLVFIFKQDGKIIFVNDDSIIQDPSMVSIRKIKILFANAMNYARLWNVSPETASLNLLKKRHLDPTFNPAKLAAQDTFFIEDIPDLFVCPTPGIPSLINYKGTTILSTGFPECWKVNLKTREAFKINIT